MCEIYATLKTTPLTSILVSLLLTLTNFTHCFGVSIVDFEQVTTSWNRFVRKNFRIKFFAISTMGKIEFHRQLLYIKKINLGRPPQTKHTTEKSREPIKEILAKISFTESNFHKKISVNLTLYVPIPQNGQTHSNNSLAICRRIA